MVRKFFNPAGCCRGSNKAYIGNLIVFFITVDRFSQFLLGTGHIKDIILDLKSQPDVFCSLLHNLKFFLRCPCQHSTGHHGSLDQCGGLVFVNIIQHLVFQRFPIILHINTLSTKHTVDAGLICNDPHGGYHTVFIPGQIKGGKHHFISSVKECHTA